MIENNQEQIARALNERWHSFPMIPVVMADDRLSLATLDAEDVAEFIEPLIRKREQETLRQHREDWASWIEDHGLYVGTVPMTQVQIVGALRWERAPFGCFVNPDIEAKP